MPSKPFATPERAEQYAGLEPHPCEDGWFWIAASRGILDPLLPDEIAYWTETGDEGD